MESGRDGAAAQPALHRPASFAEPLTTAGVELVVTLTPFYTRLKDIQRETPVKRIIATSIKEYLPPLLRVLFTLFKEKKGGHRIALEAGDLWFQDCLRTEAAAVPTCRSALARRPTIPPSC